MSKKVLILVLSADFHPYDKLMQCQQQTWDSVEVEGCETIYYCDRSNKENTDKIIYLPVDRGLYKMGHKTLAAFEWALENKEFDFIARAHSCLYVNKKELVRFIEGLPDENVLCGLKVVDKPEWCWGGIGYLISRDVVEKVVAAKEHWRHDVMEDKGISFLATHLSVPYTQGRGCSIDKMPDSWRCTSYGTESFLFNYFADIIKSEGQYFYRVKQDQNRSEDCVIMKKLFQYLQ